MEKGAVYLISTLRTNAYLTDLDISNVGFEMDQSICNNWQTAYLSSHLLYDDLLSYWMKQYNNATAEYEPSRSSIKHRLIVESIVGKDERQMVGICRAWNGSEKEFKKDASSSVVVHIPLGMLPRYR